MFYLICCWILGEITLKMELLGKTTKKFTGSFLVIFFLNIGSPISIIFLF